MAAPVNKIIKQILIVFITCCMCILLNLNQHLLYKQELLHPTGLFRLGVERFSRSYLSIFC